MPKSRIRKKADYTPPPAKQATAIKLTSRGWVAPRDAGHVPHRPRLDRRLLRDGRQLPIDALDNWNIVVGFGFIAAGFGVSTQWK